jgi:DNA-binding beta-propeller fold protein YncE
VTTYSLAAGTDPWGVAFDGNNLWFSSYASENTSVYKVSPATGAIIGTYTVGNQPEGVTFDGTYIWVAANTGNNLTRIPVY